jgi:hypothetical protein
VWPTTREVAVWFFMYTRCTCSFTQAAPILRAIFSYSREAFPCYGSIFAFDFGSISVRDGDQVHISGRDRIPVVPCLLADVVYASTGYTIKLVFGCSGSTTPRDGHGSCCRYERFERIDSNGRNNMHRLFARVCLRARKTLRLDKNR